VIWELIRSAPAATAAELLCAGAGLGAALLLPAAAAHAMDRISAGHAPGGTLIVLTALLVLSTLAVAGDGLSTAAALTRVCAGLRLRLLRAVLAMGPAERRRHRSGDLLTRVVSDARGAAGSTLSVIGICTGLAASLGGLAGLWIIDWWLGAAFLLAAAPVLVLLRRAMGRVTGTYAEYQRHLARIAARLVDALGGGRTIWAAGTTRQETGRVLAPLPDLAEASMRNWAVQRAVSWQFDLVMAGLRVTVLATGGLALASGRISAGDFLASSFYIALASGFVQQADRLFELAEAQAHIRRAYDVLGRRPRAAPAEPGSAEPGPSGAGRLTFRRVTVREQDRTILDGVELDVPAGAMVALVGRAGAGKTTLAMLAGRLLEPASGEVLIDGADVRSVPLARLRAEVAYAFDRPVLLGRTIADAIGYARPSASRSEIERAAEIAQAADFIRRLPEGFGTPLADAPFSGGEWQRLGLARAVAHGGRILVLDDATSSLDTATEARITAALDAGLSGRTRLVIAHRAGTAARADLVAWLDGGRIRATGTHADLWAAEPGYRASFTTAPPPATAPLPDASSTSTSAPPAGTGALPKAGARLESVASSESGAFPEVAPAPETADLPPRERP
jgi:ATP-binding cassette subfamily B protein